MRVLVSSLHSNIGLETLDRRRVFEVSKAGYKVENGVKHDVVIIGMFTGN